MRTIRNSIIQIALIASLAMGSAFGAPRQADAFFTEIIGSLFGGVGAVAGVALGGVPVSDLKANIQRSALQIEKFTLDNIAWVAANQLIQQMTRSTINWINNGFEGSPGFITNPGEFFADIADQVSGAYIQQLGLADTLCSPFSVQIRVALLTGARRPVGGAAQPRFSCTLSSVVQNAEAFLNDFKQGGWEGWLAISQEDSSPYLRYLNEKEDLAAHAAAAVNIKKTEASWGSGYISMRDPNDPSKITTPGVTIQNALNDALDATNRRLVVADSFNELIGALLNQLANKVLSGAGGLLGASGRRTATGPSLLDQVSIGVEEEQVASRDNVLSFVDRDFGIERAYEDTKIGSLEFIDSAKADLSLLKSCLAKLPPPITTNNQPAAGTPLTTTLSGPSVIGVVGGGVGNNTVAQDIADIEAAIRQFDTAVPGLTAELNKSRSILSQIEIIRNKIITTTDPVILSEAATQFQSLKPNIHDELELEGAERSFDAIRNASIQVSSQARTKLSDCQRII